MLCSSSVTFVIDLVHAILGEACLEAFSAFHKHSIQAYHRSNKVTIFARLAPTVKHIIRLPIAHPYNAQTRYKNMDKNQYISPSTLPFLSVLLDEREREIQKLAIKLVYGDLDTEPKFNNLIKSWEHKLLVSTLQIEIGKHLRNEFEQRNLTENQLMSGAIRDWTHYHISFGLIGNLDLLKYRPDSFGFENMEKGIIPSSGPVLYVIASLPTGRASEIEAMNLSNELLSMNYRLMKLNNEAVQKWNKKIQEKIVKTLTEARQSLAR
jgi:hypothetical protein